MDMSLLGATRRTLTKGVVANITPTVMMPTECPSAQSLASACYFPAEAGCGPQRRSPILKVVEQQMFLRLASVRQLSLFVSFSTRQTNGVPRCRDDLVARFRRRLCGRF